MMITIRTTLVLVAGVAVLGLVAASNGYDMDVVIPLDCSNSEAAKRPSTGRKVCMELPGLLKQEWPKINNIEELEDEATDCVCFLRSSGLWYKNLMTHSTRIMASAMEKTMSARYNNHQVETPLYYQIKFLNDKSKESYRKEFLEVFADAYYDHKTGEKVSGEMEANQLARHICYGFINHRVMTSFLQPTLEALEGWGLATGDKEYFLFDGSPGIMRVINLRNLCENVIGSEGHKPRNDRPAEEMNS